MTAQFSIRGAAPVASLSDLGAVEVAAIYYLRQWRDGPEGQSDMWNDFALAFGATQGRKVLKSFETLHAMCAQHGRRPLLCHGVNCKCVGADESCFANFIGYASEGEREDAMLMAINLVRPDMAFMLVGLAEEFGFALKRMTTTVDRAPGAPKRDIVFH